MRSTSSRNLLGKAVPANRISGRHIILCVFSVIIMGSDAELMSAFALGADRQVVDRFLTVFFRPLRLYREREPSSRASADFRMTLARQVDAVAYRMAPASRQAAWRVYSAACRHEPAIVKDLSWSRALVLTVLGKRAREGAADLRRFSGTVAA